MENEINSKNMLLYKVCKNDDSKTNRAVIVTLETIPDVTDMSHINGNCSSDYPIFLSDFHLLYRINCGKIIAITDLNGEDKFTTAELSFANNTVQLVVGQYFQIDNHNYKSNTVDHHALWCHKYMAAARLSVNYVSSNYTGVYYRFYPNGTIQDRFYYKGGKLEQHSAYRNDTFNTLRVVLIFRDNYPETEYLYDDRETLIGQNVYDDKGQLQHHSVP
jgi:hypothetical protein